jgi:hypothetical protein
LGKAKLNPVFMQDFLRSSVQGLVVSHVELTVMAIVATRVGKEAAVREPLARMRAGGPRTTMFFHAKCNFGAIARRKALRPILSFQHD